MGRGAGKGDGVADVTLPPTDTGAILGLDIGGTKLAAGVLTADGSLLGWQLGPSSADGPDAVIERMVALGRAAVEASGLGWDEIDGIGVGVGGPLDAVKGLVLNPPNLPGWHEVPLASRLEAALGRHVAIDNDANAAVLGEHRFGAGRGKRNVVYLTISTGIGGGVIEDGRLLRGATGNAAEIGHMSLAYDGWPCVCGGRGCLEAFASGTNIARRYREAGGDPRATARDVAERVADGEPLACEVWDETTEVLGVAIGSVINLFDPEIVVLGGGVTGAGELLFEPVRGIARGRVLRCEAAKVPIVPSALGERLGVYGAAAVALERLEREQAEG